MRGAAMRVLRRSPPPPHRHAATAAQPRYDTDPLAIYLRGDAEAVARAGALAGPGAAIRLQARRALLETSPTSGYDSVSCPFPSRQLLLSLVRMGSVTGAAKVGHGKDIEDEEASAASLGLGLPLGALLTHLEQTVGQPSLLHRSFIPTPGSDWIEGAGKTKVRILQWNVLAQSLGLHNDNFVLCPPEALSWNRRKYLMLQEILRFSPDIICLQEVDHFRLLERVLGDQGYSGMFLPKPDSPCLYLEDNNGPDGCALFWRSSKFALVDTFQRVLQVWTVQTNQVALGVGLRVRDTGEELVAATTHLKAREGPLLAALRAEQGRDLSSALGSFASGRPTVLTGDLNSRPTEPLHESLAAAGFRSAYSQEPPPYTTWTVRAAGETRGTLDYVMLGGGHFSVAATLPVPSENQLGQGKVPSYSYPSDHFALGTDLILL